MAELKNQLNSLRKDKEKISSELAEKQAIKRVGDKWKKLQERFQSLETHLSELSIRLEERHQKMTLLMRPIEDETDSEWKSVLNDFRKTRIERDLKKG